MPKRIANRTAFSSPPSLSPLLSPSPYLFPSLSLTLYIVSPSLLILSFSRVGVFSNSDKQSAAMIHTNRPCKLLMNSQNIISIIIISSVYDTSWVWVKKKQTSFSVLFLSSLTLCSEGQIKKCKLISSRGNLACITIDITCSGEWDCCSLQLNHQMSVHKAPHNARNV